MFGSKKVPFSKADTGYDTVSITLESNDGDTLEEEKVTAGMGESLMRYIIDVCGENQIIIAENELPENVDYSKANQILFSMEDGEGLCCGFLRSVRN